MIPGFCFIIEDVMKKVLIGGYYGYGNIGDEAILESLAQRLSSYPEIELTVLSSNLAYTFKTQGLKAVNRSNPFSLIKSIFGSDLFVQGGGGLLQDSTSWRSPFYYIGQLFLCQILGKRFYIMGQGIGPLNGGLAKFLTRELMIQAEAICVRDIESQYFLVQSNPTDFDVTLTADIGLLLESASEERAEDILFDEGAGDLPDPILAVSIKGKTKDKKTIEFYVDALNNYMNEVGGGILFIPFFPKFDLPFAEKIMSRITAPSICLRKSYKPSEILAVFKICEHILAGRLHASIFAALAEKNFTSISYDPKMNHFLRDLGLKMNIVMPIIGPKSIEEAMLNDLDNAEMNLQKVKKRLPSLKERAELNITKLLELLQ